MNFTKNQVDELNIELTLNIEPADYEQSEKKKLADVRRRADFKGFRKGNVPMSLVQKVYGEQVLLDTINEQINEGLQKFINDEKLRVAGEPLSSEKQPEVEWKSGNSFTFVFDIATIPEVNVEVEATDEILNYTITATAKDKEAMTENLKKYYEGKKEEKTDEEIEKEVTDQLKENYKAEADWRLTKDIRDFYVNKANVVLPEAFLKRWLLKANEGNVTAEQVEEEFPRFIEDTKWQLVRNAILKKYEITVTEEDVKAFALNYVKNQYVMYGIKDLPDNIAEDAAKNMLEDRKQLDAMYEAVEDSKAFDKVKATAILKAKKISSEKYRELK